MSVVEFRPDAKKSQAAKTCANNGDVVPLEKAVREMQERKIEAGRITRATNDFEDLMTYCENSFPRHKAKLVVEMLLSTAKNRFGIGGAA